MESEHTVYGRRSSLMSSLNGLATEHSVVNRIIQYASKKVMVLLGEFVDLRKPGLPGNIQYLPSIEESLLMFDRRKYSMFLMDTLDEFCVFRDFEVSTAGSKIYSISPGDDSDDMHVGSEHTVYLREMLAMSCMWTRSIQYVFPRMSCDGLVMNGSVRQRSHSCCARVIQYASISSGSSGLS